MKAHKARIVFSLWHSYQMQSYIQCRSHSYRTDARVMIAVPWRYPWNDWKTSIMSTQPKVRNYDHYNIPQLSYYHVLVQCQIQYRLPHNKYILLLSTYSTSTVFDNIYWSFYTIYCNYPWVLVIFSNNRSISNAPDRNEIFCLKLSSVGDCTTSAPFLHRPQICNKWLVACSAWPIWYMSTSARRFSWKDRFRLAALDAESSALGTNGMGFFPPTVI